MLPDGWATVNSCFKCIDTDILAAWHSGPPERFVRFPFGFSPAEADIPQHPIIQTPQVTPPMAALLPEVQRSEATGQQ